MRIALRRTSIELTKVIGHADREGPFRDYCAGLLAAEGRRSVEPMAVVTDPGTFRRSTAIAR
jgi:SRSO17 transposase